MIYLKDEFGLHGISSAVLRAISVYDLHYSRLLYPILVKGLSVAFIEATKNDGIRNEIGCTFFPGYALNDIRRDHQTGLTILDVRRYKQGFEASEALIDNPPNEQTVKVKDVLKPTI